MNDVPVNSLPMREKYWEELTDEQKIQKLAQQLEYAVSRLNSVADIVSRFENHVHVGDRLFFGSFNGVTPLGWPNDNILNRENGGRHGRLGY